MNESSPQLALPIALNDRACFDNFWAGHNSELIAALKQAVRAGEAGIVYLYGPLSSGKSHLLFACNQFAKQEVVNSTYLSLANSYILPAMLAELDVAHVICIDDIHLWAGDRDKEDALFTLFEQVKHAGGQLIVAAQNPPDQVGFALFDLVSRLSSGLVYPLHGLSDEQQFEAVNMRANYRGLSISEDTIRYLLTRLPRDTARLFDVLDTIDQSSLIEKRRITIPFLKKLLETNND